MLQASLIGEWADYDDDHMQTPSLGTLQVTHRDNMATPLVMPVTAQQLATTAIVQLL